MKKVNFKDQIKRNKRNSLILMVSIFLIILLMGYVIALSLSGEWFFFIIIFSTFFSMIYVWSGYKFSDKIALKSVNAKSASKKEHKEYLNLVENISISSGIPRPRAYVMPLKQINAFASGINPEKAVVCVSQGALEKLDKRELEAVIAHEMGHIKNYDIRYMTLVTVLVGMVAILSQLFLRSLWFSSGNDNEKEKIWILLVAILLAIIAPIVVKLVQFSISRKREYSADASAVMFTRNNLPLISALKKIEKESLNRNNVSQKKEEKVNKSVAQLFFSNPFSKSKIKELGSTHPEIGKRIKILKQM